MMRVDFLRRSHGASKLNCLPRGLGDYMFECGQHSHRVEIIVITNMSDAKKLPFHLRVAIGYDRAKLLAKALANGRGIAPRRRSNRRQRGRRRTRCE